MEIESVILKKIKDNLKPDQVQLINESHKHVGHVGHNVDGSSHFRLEVVSTAFDGLSRVERQRMVYTILKQELIDVVHALSLDLKTPEEVRKSLKENK